MEAATSNNVDALLERIERVRALALRLVRDAAAADDLVQEALTRALGRPVALEGDPWGWIVTTLRNLARDRARSEQRRELASARAVENAERELVEAVLALEEPYRTVVLLRFFEHPCASTRRAATSSTWIAERGASGDCARPSRRP